MKKTKARKTIVLFIAFLVLISFTVLRGIGPTHTGSMQNIFTGLDLSGGVSITYQTTENDPSDTDMADTVYKLQQRVEQYSTEAQVYRQGGNRICVEIPGVTNAEEIIAEIGKPGSLSFADENGTVVMEGTDIRDASGQTVSNQTTGATEYVVDLLMTQEGAVKFAKATEENLGKRIYVIYDGQVISAPNVQTVISDGNAQITGMESLESAQTLASFIRIGSLNLELEEVYSNVVDPQLGEGALQGCLIAGAAALAVIMLIMLIVYHISGVAASLALLTFTMLDLIALNAFDVTLTLPGIAGVVLTIGMAVDANVITYARVKEELAKGVGVAHAIDEGFRRAESAIIDGNVTTLIAAGVLFLFGSGSVRGFAQTLGIGTIISMVTALVIARYISRALYGIGLQAPGLYGKEKKRTVRPFVRMRKLTFTIAILMVLSVPAGLLYYGHNGSMLNLSLDFIGGTATTVDFGEAMSLDDLNKEVMPVVKEVTGDDAPQMQRITGTSKTIIKTKILDNEKRAELEQALSEDFPDIPDNGITTENVSGVISGEMRANAVKAFVIAIICMLVYIWIRFRNSRYAMSAILALVHDIAVVFTLYVWARLSIGNTFIAVMLTILGYSINSTIVIFDRIRENKKSGAAMDTVIDRSITETLTRSIYSTATTLIALIMLFIFGGDSIRAFTIPIMTGLVAGAFSSICITGPLFYVLSGKGGKKAVK